MIYNYIVANRLSLTGCRQQVVDNNSNGIRRPARRGKICGARAAAFAVDASAGRAVGCRCCFSDNLLSTPC